MAYVCGNSGYVMVDLDRLDVTSWEGSENADLSETTNTGDAGYKSNITCKKYMTGTLSADFDPALGPKSAPDIDAGDTVSLELNTDASGAYTIATAIITRLNWTQPAGDKVSYSVDWESSGAYSYT